MNEAVKMGSFEDRKRQKLGSYEDMKKEARCKK